MAHPPTSLDEFPDPDGEVQDSAPSAVTVKGESRAIEYIPLAERHGRVWHLGPLWFMGNAELATLAVGFLGVSLGGTLLWSLTAIVAGVLFGTLFMAFHSGQGPHLGLPQMIQSRAQFGFIGVVLPLAVVVMLCIGLNVFNLSLGGSALANSTGFPLTPSIILVAGFAAAIAGLGYVWIHKVQRVLTYGFLIVFAFFSVGVVSSTPWGDNQLSVGTFAWIPFLVQFGAAVGYQLSWAPYVSDYSRYLPASVTTRSTVAWTYIGSASAAVWLMGLGAVLYASYPEFGPVEAIRVAGDAIMPGFGTLALVLSALGLITIASVNMYSGSLTLLSLLDSLRPAQFGLVARVIAGTAVGATALIMAIATSDSFLSYFGSFLLIMLYFMTPWTAVNLVDYYFVRRGHYQVQEIFKPNGVYGRWGSSGLISYFGGFVAMIPFFSTGLYTGPIAKALGGSDVSFFVGLPVSAVLYYVLARSRTSESTPIGESV